MWKRNALIFLLSVLIAGSLLVGCTAASPGQSDEFVICTGRSSASFCNQLLSSFKTTYPNIVFRLETLPVSSSDPMEREAVEAKMEKLRTEIMSGRGPDLFLLSAHDRLLISDPDKSMRAGVFLDLSPYMEQLAKDLDLNETVLAAGAVGDAQYLIPLSYSLPGVVAAAERLVGCGAGMEDAPAIFLQKLLTHCGAPGYAPICPLLYMSNHVLFSPVLDVEAAAVNLDGESLPYFSLLAQAMAWREETGYLTGPDDFLSPESPFYAELLGFGMNAKNCAYQLLAQGQEPVVLPIPNGRGGVTASIGLYAGVRANSPQAELAVEILHSLLATESMADSSLYGTIFAYPINRDALRPLYEAGFSPDNFINNRLQLDCADLVDQFVDADTSVNAARFSDMGDDLLYYDLLVPVVMGRATLEEAAGDFAKKYRFYFDE